MSSTATRRRVELTDGRVVIRKIVVETEGVQIGQPESFSDAATRSLNQAGGDIDRAAVGLRRIGWRGAFWRHR